MKGKKTIVIVILSMVFFIGNFFGKQEEIPFVWRGKIIVRQKKLPGPGLGASGEVITEWQLDVNWKETRKNDIRDKRGRLVGQMVKLEDNGSSWIGTTSGKFVNRSGETQYSGSGEGPGPVISTGYIYYSLSDDDPLKSVLPHGSYSFGSAPGQTQTFEETVTMISYGAPTEHTMNLPAYLGYYVSKSHIFFLPFGHIGGPTLDGPTSAESIKATIERSASLIPQSLPIQWDRETRVLDEGRMRGSFSHRWLNNTVVNEVEWDISKVSDIQCAMEKPNKYWRPKGGEEKNSLDIMAKIEKYDSLKGKWRFTLFEVSREKGYAMNKGERTELDLEFLEGQNDFTPPEKTEDGWVIESTKAASSMTVKVQSLDYGAWGKLKAEVNVEGHWYQCLTEYGQDYITIPYDDDEDHIADMWEEQFDVISQSAEEDEDPEPESKQDGDGFSNYEEYRGFFVNGIWREWYFSPKRKDIFIYDEIGMGVSYFTETGLMIHLIDKEEYDDDRIVNFNRGFATLASQDGQKGLYLCEEPLVGLGGQVWPCIGTPNVVDKVIIDTLDPFMKAVYAEKGAEGGFLKNYASSIAHELGHAVNMVHHGDEMWEAGNGYEIARRGGLWSGDICCVMRYSPPDRYLGSDNNIYPYPQEDPSSRTGYCSSSAGTGINAPGERIGPDGHPYPIAGNAEKGNCRYNITLKGYNKWGN